MIKKLRIPSVYAVMAVICIVVMFPLFLAVILPLQSSDELAKTLSKAPRSSLSSSLSIGRKDTNGIFI